MHRFSLAFSARFKARFNTLLLTLAGLILSGTASLALASASGVVISQVYGGNGNTFASDYVELFNAGSTTVNITGWSIQYASATGTGNFSGNGVTTLSGSLQPGQYYLVKLRTNAGALGAALPPPDATGGGGNAASATDLSGTNGKVILANASTGLTCNGGSTACSPAQLAQIVDLVGYGSANFYEGTAAAPAANSTTALFRAVNGCTDTDQNNINFATGTPSPRNTASPLQPCSSNAAIIPVCPASATVASGSSVDLALSASDADGIVNAAAFLSGNVAGMSLNNFTAAPATGGTATVTLNIGASVALGTYPVAVNFSNNDSPNVQNASCTINVTVSTVGGSYTPIYSIQGSGTTSPMSGGSVTTRGVVTLVTNAGFFMQDETGDGNAATSDGIFVYQGVTPSVTAGQRIQLTGNISEFNTGSPSNAQTLANPLTELTTITNLTQLGNASIAPTVITLPVAAVGDLERYEGMLVTINNVLTASQNYFQGRYGEVTLSANGRLYKPTHLHRPGTQQAIDLSSLNARNTILLDDATSQQNPNPIPYIGTDFTLRAGDTLPNITGVIDYGLATSANDGFALYRIQPTVVPAFTRVNARTSAPAAVGGSIKVASFNVLNFFTTFTNGATASGGTGQGCTLGGSTSASNCRGADNLAEFNRQRNKILAAMAAINADVFGLMELQNNGTVAAQNLVDGLNAIVGANTYAVVPSPPDTGTDAIRVGMIYKPAVVTLSGAPLSDSDAINNRPPFAQAFIANGQKFSVIVNHMKSKSCSGATGPDADQNDGQGCYNDRRKQQAQRLLTFMGTVQAAAGDNDVLVIGDLNSYGKEDPIDILTSAGLVNQAPRFEANSYSYVFDGEAGSLDHTLASPSLSAQITGANDWHINADEPSVIDYNTEFKPQDLYTATAYRASDHDPIIVGLSLGTAAAQTISFGALPDRILGAADFNVSATASSGLSVSFSSQTPAVCTVSGSTVHLVALGVCSIAADQAGNASYLAAPTVTQSFTVRSFQSITFNPLPNHALGEAPFAISASASSGLGVSFSTLTASVCTVSGNTVTLVATGICSIAADQSGNTTYAAAAQVSQSFEVTSNTGGGNDADVPTLPEWGALLMSLILLVTGVRQQRRRMEMR